MDNDIRFSSPEVMGIINVNNESFYEESRVADAVLFRKRLGEMVGDGASIIDIGACSTRPGSVPVTMEQEWSSLEPVLRYLSTLKRSTDGRDFFLEDGAGRFGISIDTFRSEIVRRACDLIGYFTVNDISSGEDDSRMLPSVGELGLGYIAMHKRGTPDTMQQMCYYPDGVVREVANYFISFAERAADCGINDYVVDPGFGFAKSVEQNYELFRGMPEMMDMISSARFAAGGVGRPKLLVGISRKSMLCKPLQITPQDALPATAAMNLQALISGADILRVHDVKEAAQMVTLYKLLNICPALNSDISIL